MRLSLTGWIWKRSRSSSRWRSKKLRGAAPIGKRINTRGIAAGSAGATDPTRSSVAKVTRSIFARSVRKKCANMRARSAKSGWRSRVHLKLLKYPLRRRARKPSRGHRCLDLCAGISQARPEFLHCTPQRVRQQPQLIVAAMTLPFASLPKTDGLPAELHPSTLEAQRQVAVAQPKLYPPRSDMLCQYGCALH